MHPWQVDGNGSSGKGGQTRGKSLLGVIKCRSITDLLIGEVFISRLNDELLGLGHLIKQSADAWRVHGKLGQG